MCQWRWIFCLLFAATLFTPNSYARRLKVDVGPPEERPEGLVDIVKVNENVRVDMAYAGINNFMDRPVKGYVLDICLLKLEAATAVAEVNDQLGKSGMRLVLRDCWRPVQATLDMVAWAKATDSLNILRSEMDERHREIFDDDLLFDDGLLVTSKLLHSGYLSGVSNHNFGATVDLEIERYDRQSGSWQFIDMGTRFDVFSPKASHRANKDRSEAAKENRKMLVQVMHEHKFYSITNEWWHWTFGPVNGGPRLDGYVR